MESRRRLFIILTSILLHILLLFLWEKAVKLKLIDFDVPSMALTENEPIVFDLQQPEGPTEIIENPADATVAKPPEKPKFLSDKNALARNAEPAPPDLIVDEAFARGVVDSHDLPEKPENEVKNDREEEKKPVEASKHGQDVKEDRVAALLSDQPQEPLRSKMAPEPPPSVPHDNRTSRAPGMGGMSFSTYDWDFAPYMLVLKKNIRKNIFPPAGFYVGMTQGENLLRFKIYPNGELKGLEILGYQGDKSLTETSYNAIDALAPLPPLPRHFPDPYLGVIVKFSYSISRGNR